MVVLDVCCMLGRIKAVTEAYIISDVRNAAQLRSKAESESKRPDGQRYL